MESPITAKAALLQALVSGPGYGLDLIQRIQTSTGGRLTLAQGSVYPALKALEWDGLAESYDGTPTPERGGRPRRYFKLSVRGVQVAAEHRAIVSEVFHLVPEVPVTQITAPVHTDKSATTFWVLVHAIQQRMMGVKKHSKKEG